MTYYVHQLNENTLITHDGHVQMGLYHMSLEDFHRLSRIDYIEVHWIPDTFKNRYKRVNYQRHLNCASIGTKQI